MTYFSHSPTRNLEVLGIASNGAMSLELLLALFALLVSIRRLKQLLLLKTVPNELQADGQPPAVLTAGNADARQSRQIHGNGINIPQIHLNRICQALSQLRRGGGRHRPKNQIVFFKGSVEGLLNQRFHLQRLQIVGIVIAGTQHERPKHDAAFYFLPKALRAGFLVHIMKALTGFGAVTVLNAVKPLQVGTGLRRRDGIVCGNRVFHQA